LPKGVSMIHSAGADIGGPSTRSSSLQATIPAQRRRPQSSDARAVAGRRILIVGINYWPELTGIAPYTTDLAEYLSSHGAAVQVVTGLPCYPGWTVLPRYRHLRMRENRNGVHVQRVAHTVPRRQDALRRGAYEASFLLHASTMRPARGTDLVIGVTPALAGAVAAAWFAERIDAPLVTIVQDLLGSAASQSGIAGGRQVAGSVRRLEGWALRQANRVVTISDGFHAPIVEYGVPAERVHRIPNWARVETSHDDRAATRAKLGWAEGELVALHTGNMGLKQDLGNIVEAARLTHHRDDLRWVLMGDGSQRDQLRRQGHGLSNLDFLPLCNDSRYPAVLDAADVLLLNERADMTDMSLPSKLTSYFTSGRPVAAAVALDGASARELERAGAAPPAPPADPAALVRAVDRLRGPADRTLYGQSAQNYARHRLTLDGAMRRLIEVLP
jgi:glycosyltransferase involved in cell wall biosynthesis